MLEIRSFVKAFHFLNNHPGLNIQPYTFLKISDFYIFPKNKRNIININYDHNLKVNYFDIVHTDKTGKYMKNFLKLMKKNKIHKEKIYDISFSYRQIFKEKWELDKLIYFLDLNIITKNLDIENIKTIQDKSFEKLMIKTANYVKKNLGNFSFRDMLTEKEKKLVQDDFDIFDMIDYCKLCKRWHKNFYEKSTLA